MSLGIRDEHKIDCLTPKLVERDFFSNIFFQISFVILSLDTRSSRYMSKAKNDMMEMLTFGPLGAINSSKT